ncbi:MAG: PIG-L family deacetylase [Phycisphaerae bacterium]|nr:PIG-L family deacetylase [Phycisphaerae bacterium]
MAKDVVVGQRAAVIVAHPDDEVLWAGGMILSHPELDWHVVAVCRASDADRAPKFQRVVDRLGALGALADLDDGPEQTPLPEDDLRQTVRSLLPDSSFDLVLTHGPRGEYTRHRRHEEVCRAVVALWESGDLRTTALWMFAYEDGDRAYLPRPDQTAHRTTELPDARWNEKYRLITEAYGFDANTWEAKTTPRVEAFWCFESPADAREWIGRQGVEP